MSEYWHLIRMVHTNAACLESRVQNQPSRTLAVQTNAVHNHEFSRALNKLSACPIPRQPVQQFPLRSSSHWEILTATGLFSVHSVKRYVATYGSMQNALHMLLSWQKGVGVAVSKNRRQSRLHQRDYFLSRLFPLRMAMAPIAIMTISASRPIPM